MAPKPPAELMRDIDIGDPAPERSPPIACPIFDIEGQRIRVMSTVMRFDNARDVTVADLKVELMFPIDEASASFFKSKHFGVRTSVGSDSVVMLESSVQGLSTHVHRDRLERSPLGVEKTVHHHPIAPRTEAALVLKTGKNLQDMQQSILCFVFGVGWSSEEADRQV